MTWTPLGYHGVDTEDDRDPDYREERARIGKYRRDNGEMNLDRLHELCDWENELSFHDGYVAGYAAANAEMAEAIRYMLGGPSARSWRQAVDQHHWALNARRRREAADAIGPMPGDHPGGPVDFETGILLYADLSDQ